MYDHMNTYEYLLVCFHVYLLFCLLFTLFTLFVFRRGQEANCVRRLVVAKRVKRLTCAPTGCQPVVDWFCILKFFTLGLHTVL